jgi:hypothetical protein
MDVVPGLAWNVANVQALLPLTCCDPVWLNASVQTVATHVRAVKVPMLVPYMWYQKETVEPCAPTDSVGVVKRDVGAEEGDVSRKT